MEVLFWFVCRRCGATLRPDAMRCPSCEVLSVTSPLPRDIPQHVSGARSIGDLLDAVMASARPGLSKTATARRFRVIEGGLK